MAPPDASQNISRIKRVLRRAGYTEGRIKQLLDVAELPTDRQRSQSAPLYRWRARGGSPLEILVRLFLLGQTGSLDEVRRGIEPTQLEDWVAAGLLDVNGGHVTAIAELCPYGSLVLAADWADGAQPDLHQVMGIAASSRTLAQATIRRHSKATLDLGTGCGILALLAAAHSERIVAVDSNPRALAMAQLNTRLNGVANIEFLEGDLFEPVKGSQFDLIVCNPPFVVAPEQIYLHSHSDMPLDGLCETLIRTAPAFMREGGYCQLLCNWVQRAGEDWQARLQSWFDGSGCDAWILHSHSEDAADYAFKRISNLGSSAEQLEERFNRWIGCYERERVEAVGFGMITMRRSNRAANWFQCDSWPKMIGPCGDAIERRFAGHDFIEAHRDDDKLLGACLDRAPNLQRQQRHELSADGWQLNQAELQLTSGLAFSGKAGPEVVDFISRCDGKLRLRDYLNEQAAAGHRDTEKFTADFLRVVRRLIELGFLYPRWMK